MEVFDQQHFSYEIVAVGDAVENSVVSCQVDVVAEQEAMDDYPFVDCALPGLDVAGHNFVSSVADVVELLHEVVVLVVDQDEAQAADYEVVPADSELALVDVADIVLEVAGDTVAGEVVDDIVVGHEEFHQDVVDSVVPIVNESKNIRKTEKHLQFNI